MTLEEMDYRDFPVWRVRRDLAAGRDFREQRVTEVFQDLMGHLEEMDCRDLAVLKVTRV